MGSCNRRWSCLNSKMNLPSRCDYVDSLSLRFEVLHDDRGDWGYLKYLAIYHGESDGWDIDSFKDLCYLESSTSATTSESPTQTTGSSMPTTIATSAAPGSTTRETQNTNTTFESSDPNSSGVFVTRTLCPFALFFVLFL